MPGKQIPTRFTLSFSAGDPDQLAVAELLNTKGRTKARFITAAVLHYINSPQGSTGSEINRGAIEEIILDILSRQKVEEGTSTIQEKGRESAMTEEVPDQAALDAIMGTMAAFRIQP